MEDYEGKFSPSELKLKGIHTSTTFWTVGMIVQQYKNGHLVIPKIQRGYVWNEEKARRFIMSLLQGFPIPPIFIIELSGKFYVVDGQQRIRTILWFLGEDNELLEKLGPLRVPIKELAENYNEYGVTNLSEAIIKKIIFGNHPKEFNYKYFTKDFRQYFESLSIPVQHISISSGKEYILTDIFLRINQGSVKLSAMELWRVYYGKDIEEYFHKLNELARYTVAKIYEVSNGKISRQKLERFRIDEFILTFDVLINGLITPPNYIPKDAKLGAVIFSQKTTLKKVKIFVLENRRKVFKNNKGELKKFLDYLEREYKEILKMITYVLGEFTFRRPTIGNECQYALIRPSGNDINEAVFLYEVAIFKLLKDNGHSELIYENKDFIKHVILTSLIENDELFSRSTSTFRSVANKLELAKLTYKKIITKEDNITKDNLKRLLYEKFRASRVSNPVCPYCKEPISDISVADLAHIRPLAFGGQTYIHNLTLAHSTCNRRFGVRDISQYINRC